MFCVYIIYSEKINRFYIGTTDDFEKRLQDHNNRIYNNAYTSRGIPWEKFLLIENLTTKQAYLIEKHIKKMKSKKYIENLMNYTEIVKGLIQRYQ